MDQNSRDLDDQPTPVDAEVDAALDAAHAHARAAGALVQVILASNEDRVVDLADLAEALSFQGAPAADLVRARIATSASLSGNMLRLVAESLAAPEHPEPILADIRKATRATPRSLAPLSMAFSGLSLITRALSARHGRDIGLTIAADVVEAPEDQMDDWRHAAMLMANFALDSSRLEDIHLHFEAHAYGAAVSLSVNLPNDVRIARVPNLADRLITGLTAPDAQPAQPDTILPALAELDLVASRLDGSLSIEPTGAGRRLILLARRVSGVIIDKAEAHESSRKARRLSLRRAMASVAA